MPIYVIFENEIHDVPKYDEYKKAVPKYVARHGGEYIARDGNFEVPVGDWQPNRIVIFKWPSRDALDAFQADPDYQPWKKLRESVTTTKQLLIVEGLTEPPS